MIQYEGMTKIQIQERRNFVTRMLTNKRFLLFSGNTNGFQVKIQDMKKQSIFYTEAHITINGQEIKATDTCCLISTIILGSFFLFPYLLMCFDWWKKIVYAAYQVPYNIYQNLQIMMQSPQLAQFTLIVNDSLFNAQKANIIHDCLLRSNIKNFTFYNIAPNIDYRQKQFTNFDYYMRSIKSLPIKTKLQWFNKKIE